MKMIITIGINAIVRMKTDLVIVLRNIATTVRRVNMIFTADMLLSQSCFFHYSFHCVIIKEIPINRL